MARIPDRDVERLKQSVSMEALCRLRGIELKKHGGRDLIGLCPFHEDKKPSFVVTPAKNLFHCMGCDAAGSVIDLVMRLDQLSFREAVDKLIGSPPKVKRASPLSSAPAAALQVSLSPERARLLLERVVAVYEKSFAEAPEGRAYLEGRGITDAGLFAQYRVGFCNGRLKEILPEDEQVKGELSALGVLLSNGRERFEKCVLR